jgi:hypothetical protein
MRFFSRNHRITTFISLLTIGVGFVLVTGAFADPPLGIQGDVTVTNTPLPVTGNITSTVTGSVDANVTNDETNPVPVYDVDNPARAPFSMGTAGNFTNTSNFLDRSFDTLPPIGTTFVIEYVTIEIDNNFTAPADQIYHVDLELVIGGVRRDHHIGIPELAPSTPSGAGSQIRQLGKVVKLYADPNSTMSCEATRKYTGTEARLRCTLVGHLVNGS